MGNMPNGIMKATIKDEIECEGYPKVGTIIIEYIIDNGILNGHQYYGTKRSAYLPNIKEGI